jgi:eukaryotic-like serine/threonine-protein kinase
LRLPELSSGSTLKRDPRSDVTFAAGILFYLLSGIVPAQLIDQDGKMPHQRPDVAGALASLDGLDIDRLLALFDQAFDHRIDHRFQDAVTLSGAIRDCVLRDTAAESMNLRAKMDRIKARVMAPSEVSIRESMELLRQTLMGIQNATLFVSRELGEAFDLFLTGFTADVRNLHSYYTIGLTSKAYPHLGIKPTYHARIAGNEIVVSVNDVPIFRSDANRVGHAALHEAVKVYLISQLDEVMSTRSQ